MHVDKVSFSTQPMVYELLVPTALSPLTEANSAVKYVVLDIFTTKEYEHREELHGIRSSLNSAQLLETNIL